MAIIIILSIIFFILAVFSLVYIFNAVDLLWNTLLKKEAPFVPLQKNIVNFLVEEMTITKDNVVYDLGCGDGRVLFSLAKKYPAGRYIGVEKNILPFFLARINFILRGRPKNVSILKRDMFRCDYSDATHIFTYLFPDHMNRLYDKLEKELQKGALLFSCAFRFKRKEAVKILEIPQKGILGPVHRKIFVYEF